MSVRRSCRRTTGCRSSSARYSRGDLPGGLETNVEADYTRFQADAAAHRPAQRPAQLHAGADQPALAGARLVRDAQAAAARHQLPVRRAAGQRGQLGQPGRSHVQPGQRTGVRARRRVSSAAASARRWSRGPSTCTRRIRDQSLLPNYDSGANDFNFATIYTENAFGGNDRISDNNLLTLGASTRLLDPDTGAEAARFGVAQRLRFKDQLVTLPGGTPVSERLSDILFGASVNWTPQWSVDSTVQYNPKTGRSIRSTVGGRYSPGNYRVISAAYRLQRGSSEQIDIGWQWPLNDLWGDKGQNLGPGQGEGEGRWYSVGRLNLSLKDGRVVDSIVGLEYDAGCWLGRVVFERLQSSTSTSTKRILFQLEFVGFARLGSNALQTLKQNVPRYQFLREQIDLTQPLQQLRLANTMNQRVFALWLTCAAQAMALTLPAAAQGFRLPPAGRGPGRPPVPPTPVRARLTTSWRWSIPNPSPTTKCVRAWSVSSSSSRSRGSRLPPRPDFARQVLERLISEKAQLQLARESGIRVEESAVDQAEQNVARQNQIDVAELRRRLASDGLPLSRFRDELRNQLLVTRLRERELEARVDKVTDLEVDQYIRDRSTSNDPSALELNLAHILVAGARERHRGAGRELAGAGAAVAAARACGRGFCQAGARGIRCAGRRPRGGVVGLRTADRYPPLFVQAAQALPEGGVSELVRSGAGFHVIKVIEKRRGGLPGATVVQSHARHILLRPNAQLSETAARQRLADFKKRVEAGQADFAQLARENSQDASATSGGDLGWAAPGLFVPEFEEALNSLAPGQIAEPVMSRFGVHLIQLLERRQATLTQREQREVARNLVREKKLDEAYVQWAQEVRGRAYVEFREPPS